MTSPEVTSTVWPSSFSTVTRCAAQTVFWSAGV